MHVGRDAAAIVGHRAGTVGIQRDGHMGGVARQRLVDGIVDHLVDHVMQTGPVIRVADIHARPFANRIQALQNLDGIGTIFRIVALGRIAHVVMIFPGVGGRCVLRARITQRLWRKYNDFMQ